jgi:hypothetical protein
MAWPHRNMAEAQRFEDSSDTALVHRHEEARQDPVPQIAQSPARAACWRSEATSFSNRVICTVIAIHPCASSQQAGASPLGFSSSAGDVPGRGQIPQIIAKLANGITNRLRMLTVREIGYPAPAVALWAGSGKGRLFRLNLLQASMDRPVFIGDWVCHLRTPPWVSLLRCSAAPCLPRALAFMRAVSGNGPIKRKFSVVPLDQLHCLPAGAAETVIEPRRGT